MSLSPLLDPTLLPTLLEAAMLLCLGTAWPLANLALQWLLCRRPALVPLAKPAPASVR